MTNNKSFVTITNKDIYLKVCSIEKHVMLTNGKVRVNTWRSITSLTLIIALILGLLGNKFGFFF